MPVRKYEADKIKESEWYWFRRYSHGINCRHWQEYITQRLVLRWEEKKDKEIPWGQYLYYGDRRGSEINKVTLDGMIKKTQGETRGAEGMGSSERKELHEEGSEEWQVLQRDQEGGGEGKTRERKRRETTHWHGDHRSLVSFVGLCWIESWPKVWLDRMKTWRSGEKIGDLWKAYILGNALKRRTLGR